MTGQIVELDAAVGGLPVGHAADDHHAPLRGRDDAVQQLGGQQEVSQMVDDELHLDALDLLQRGQEHAGVADESIDRHSHRADLPGAGHDGREVTELEDDGCDMACDVGAGVATLFQGTCGADHVRTPQRQDTQGLVADPGIAAGDDHCLAAQIDSLGDGIGGRVGIEVTHGGLDLAAPRRMGECGGQQAGLDEVPASEIPAHVMHPLHG